MRHLRIILTLLIALSARFGFADEASSALEYKVKAVVLFNFAKYVKWPEKTFSNATDPIQVCILGKSPFGDIFQSPEAPKEAQNRPDHRL